MYKTFENLVTLVTCHKKPRIRIKRHYASLVRSASQKYDLKYDPGKEKSHDWRGFEMLTPTGIETV